MLGGGHGDYVFPDMKLYEEILFLKHFYKGKWVVENVIPYYEPLIEATKVDRHLYWSNFKISNFVPAEKPNIEWASIKDLEQIYGFDLSGVQAKGKNDKRKMLRNCVHPETGLHILNCALNTVPKKAIHSLFDDSVIYL